MILIRVEYTTLNNRGVKIKVRSIKDKIELVRAGKTRFIMRRLHQHSRTQD